MSEDICEAVEKAIDAGKHVAGDEVLRALKKATTRERLLRDVCIGLQWTSEAEADCAKAARQARKFHDYLVRKLEQGRMAEAEVVALRQELHAAYNAIDKAEDIVRRTEYDAEHSRP